MVVKFFLPKHRRAAARRNNKKLAVGQLVGSKTDLREGEEDEDQEDDNVSALELALNHSDTIAMDVRNKKADSKKVSNFRLLPTMITRRKSTPPQTRSDPKLRSIGEEKRDDCADDSILDRQSREASLGPGTMISDQQSKADSLRIESPIEVTVTPEALTGLIFKRYSQKMKSSAGTNGPNGSVKVKGYIRVVGKAAGVKIVSGSVKIVKSYRLGTKAAPNGNPNQSTLFFSNESSGMKSTGSLRIVLPPPKTSTTSGASNYDVLTFEVGVLTPDGIFPLGTTTYQPMARSSISLYHKDVLKVDSVHRGSIFQRRKVVVVSPKSSSAANVNDKDSYYRLLRRSTLSASFAVKPLSEKEYMASRHKQDPKSTNKSAEVLPKPLSYLAAESTQGIGSDDVPQDVTDQNEMRRVKSEPSVGLIMYLSDPLSCCSDRDVDSGDDEAIPEDLQTQVTVPSTDLLSDLLNEEEQTQVALSMDDLEVGEVTGIHETDQQRDVDPTMDEQTENSCWCFLLPICCCVGTSNKFVDGVQNDATTVTTNAAISSALDNELPHTESHVYDAVVQPKYLATDDVVSNEDKNIHDEKLSRSRHRYGDDIVKIMRSESDLDVPQDRSVVGTRNCCMACFGDEDVEKLKYAKLKPKTEETILAVDTADQTTDAIDNDLVGGTSQPASNELSRVIQDVVAEREQLTATAGGGNAQMPENENDECNELSDRDVAPRVDAVLGTMTSSYGDDDDDDEETVYTISFSEDLDIDANVGCFQWMDAASSEGLETDISMSVVSSESQSDSFEGIVVRATDPARIPISKSEDVTTFPPNAPHANIKLQSNSIS